MTETITIRRAEPSDLEAVAGLRWQWMTESGDTPTTLERPAFTRHFMAWAAENSSSHHCMVLIRDSEVIGMTWLAVVPRVPTPQSPHRASGDLQCVYVTPDARDTGLGGRLITETLAAAKSLGLERVTVHSSPRAIPAYARQGFENSPRLLHTRMEAVAGFEPT